jgi:hypothetical protein
MLTETGAKRALQKLIEAEIRVVPISGRIAAWTIRG